MKLKGYKEVVGVIIRLPFAYSVPRFGICLIVIVLAMTTHIHTGAFYLSDAVVSSPTTLDATGQTIPDTDYAIPTGAIFMATTGSDANSGTLSQPVATLNRAIALVSTGGTIVVRGGVYRDWYNNGTTYAALTKSLTLQAYPHEQVWFDGTNIEPTNDWTSDGSGHWSMSWSTPSFCANQYYSLPYNQQNSNNTGPCTHIDMSEDPANPAAGDPQLVYIDGTYVHEVTSLAAAVGNNFYYDQSARRIYIGTNPSGHTVELAARPMAINSGAANLKILGLGFRRYATNEYSNSTGGAIYSGGNGSLFENDTFTEMAGPAMQLAPENAIVRSSVFANNGMNGFGANGHQHSTGEHDGIVIEGNVFNNNNTERFGTGCSLSCAAAGVKLAHMDGFTVKNNIFENGQGVASGFWCDLACTDGVIVDNIARNNGGTGLFYEVSSEGVIASNLVVGNAQYGIRVGSATTEVYNNTIVGSGIINLWIYDDSRSPGVGGWTDVGPDTTGLKVANNIIDGSPPTSFKISRSSSVAPNTGPGQFFNSLDYDSYYRPTGTSILVNWTDTASTYYTALAKFTADHGFESHGQDLTGTSDPYFINQTSGNYVVRPGSVAYDSGTVVPSDVATDVGITATTGLSRGAIIWPGQTGNASVTPTPVAVPGDINGDGKVNALDLSIMLTHWNTVYTAADLDHNGTVNIIDLSILLRDWTG